MTPEAFEAKWGEALRAAGHGRLAAFVREIPDCYGVSEQDAQARGLLVAWAVERRAYIEPSRNLDEDGIECGWSFRTRHLMLATRLGFDAALIAGCIALAKQEADQ